MKAIIPKVSALLLVMAALLVSASVAQATEPATVTVTRSGFQIRGLLLYVDGKPFAKLANNESKTFTIPAGDHYLGVPKWGGDISWGTRSERDLFVQAGKLSGGFGGGLERSSSADTIGGKVWEDNCSPVTSIAVSSAHSVASGALISALLG